MPGQEPEQMPRRLNFKNGKENHMNKVILMGRLTRDPEVRYTQGDHTIAIARYSLAVDRRYNHSSSDNQTADFINCVAFGKNGEFAEKYLHKGIKIIVEGRIQTGSYTNKDGVKVYTTDVVVESQEFAESKNATQNRNEEENKYANPQQQSSDGFMNIPDELEKLPFS